MGKGKMETEQQKRLGYKWTKLGWVPEAWEVAPIEGHVKILSGYPFKSENYSEELGDIKLLRGDNIMQGFLRWADVKYWSKNSLENLDKYFLERGDLVIAMDRTWVSKGLKVAVIANEDLPCLLVQRVCRLRAKLGIEQGLLQYFFSSHRFEQYVKEVQKESAVPHISLGQIKEFSIPIPPLPEQQKIAAILSTWDKAIELTQQLIAAKEEQKKGLMQRLLTGKVRLKGFEGEWKKVKLKSIVQRITQKNEELNDNVVTISAQRGFVKQEEFFNKRVASEILTHYYLVEKGDFCYNKSYSNGYPMGAFKRLDDYEKAVVTTLYICFRLKLDKVDSDFVANYFEGGLMVKGLMKIAQEGGRAHGLLNIGLEDFFNLKMMLPPKEVQVEIGKLLRLADNEINLLNRQLDSLKEQKKGLMQQLLTGKIQTKN